MRFILALINFLSLIFCNVIAQPKQEWVQRYNGPANSFDIVSKMLIDKNNNVYVYGNSNGIGSLYDFTIIKYSSSGNVKWIQRYNGPGNGTDQINSSSLDENSNSYITGFTTDSNSITNITTTKYDSNGNLLWIKVFNKAGYTNGFGQDISLDGNGNVIVCGFLRASNGTYDIVTIKYSNTGNEIRNTIYNGDGNGDDIPVSIKTDDSNNIIVAGSSKSFLNNLDIIVLKYNSSSALLWFKTFNGSANSDDRASSLILDNESKIYLSGNINNNNSYLDYFFVKLDSNGAVQWSGNYNGTGNSIDVSSSITIDSYKNVFLTGYSRRGSVLGTEDILTMKLLSNGSILWTSNFNGAGNGFDQGNSITADNSGNVFVGGAADRGNVQEEYALLKYDSTGSLKWSDTYSVSTFPEDFIYNVVLDKSNNIYVTGISIDTLTDYDFATIKYSETVGVKNISNEMPEHFFLSQNYPNPFNPLTVISYKLQITNYISLKIFDVLGNEVASLVNQKQNAGSYSVDWDASNFPSGIYFYRLETNNFSETKRMMLLK